MSDGREISFFDIEEPVKRGASKKRSVPSARKQGQGRPSEKAPERVKTKTSSAGKASGAAAANPSAEKAKRSYTQGDRKVSRKGDSAPGTKKTSKPSEQVTIPIERKSEPAREAVRRREGEHHRNGMQRRAPEPRRERRPVRRHGHPRRRPSALTPVMLLLLFLIGAFTVVLFWRMDEYRQFTVMKDAVNTSSFYQGMTVEGIELSGMTREQAENYWRENIEPKYAERTVTIGEGGTVTARELGYSSDYQRVLRSVWSDVNSGTLRERYAQVVLGSARAYDVTRKMYDDSIVRARVDAYGDRIDRAPVDASILSFDTESTTFEVDEGSEGQSLDREALVRDIETTLDNGGGNVEVRMETVPQALTADTIRSTYGMITFARTNASSSSDNRISNLKLALSLINGTCLKPGESFSFNETVGKRTVDRGFKKATAYSSGAVTQEVGGGICQVSTTLFNAAVKANLQIDERHPHSLTVHYVDPGKDAAVDWGNKDLKFTNTSQDSIFICCYLDESKTVRVGIFGKLFSDGGSITVEGKKIRDVDYTTEYEQNFSMPQGSQKVTQNGKKGCVAETWKVYWDAEGREINRVKLYTSTYKATPKIVEVGIG